MSHLEDISACLTATTTASYVVSPSIFGLVEPVVSSTKVPEPRIEWGLPCSREPACNGKYSGEGLLLLQGKGAFSQYSRFCEDWWRFPIMLGMRKAAYVLGQVTNVQNID